MRTTLTLDDDVAVQLERLRRSRDANLKDLVNEALRLGLREMTAKRSRDRAWPDPVLDRRRFCSISLGATRWPCDDAPWMVKSRRRTQDLNIDDLSGAPRPEIR